MGRLTFSGLLGSSRRGGSSASKFLPSLAAAAALFVVILVVGAGATYVVTDQASADCEPTTEVEGHVGGLPPEAQKYADFYVEAAAKYKLGPRGPAILASIHQTETRFGELNMVTSSAGAIGHMQFMPATWASYGVDANGDGKKDPHEAEDAIHAAARYLRASGAPRDWHAAIFSYNHAEWYVDDILEGAEAFGDVGEVADATTTTCKQQQGAAGPADLQRAVRLYEPKGFKSIPTSLVAPGFGPVKVETRIHANVVWILREYDLVLTAGAESGHATHGDGTAIDAVPRDGSTIANWRSSAERLAEDLGWTPGCASSGVAPVCDLVPAIHGVFYNGYPSHGDPAHCTGGCGPHIHVSWASDTYGTSVCCVSPSWIMVFPSPTDGEAEAPVGTGPAGDSEVLVVGDSLSVGTTPYLKDSLGGHVEIDAEVSRPSGAGLSVLRQTLDSGHQVVAFDLGTNDDPSQPATLAENLRRARAITGSRCLVVASVNRPGSAALNRVIRGFADSTSNVELFDWHAISAGTDLLGSDGIHATPAGYRRRAETEIDAMRGC